MATETLSVEITADIAGFREELASAQRLSHGFSRAISSGLAGAVADGRRFSDVLRGIGLELSGLALRASLKPLTDPLAGLAGSLFGRSGLGGLLGGSLKAFARGGVLGGPALFPLGRGLGLAGEAGPEAILPLARGADGSLGVRAPAMGAQPHITFNITTPDADSFRRSQSQVSAMVSRAVMRGQRNL